MVKNKSRIRKTGALLVKLLFGAFIVALLMSYLSPFIHPDYLWWVAFFGLSYPLLISLGLIITLICFIKKWRIKWLFLGVILMGIPIHLRYFSFSSSKAIPANETTLRVMSYNVRLFDVYNWMGEERADITRENIISYITAIAPEVLCIQEYYSDKQSDGYITPERIKRIGNFIDAHYQLMVETKNKDFGIAIFSRYPILEKGSVFNPDEPDQFCIYTDIVKAQDTFRIYTTHLQSVKFQQEDYQLFTDSSLYADNKTANAFGIIKKLKVAYPPRVEQAERILLHSQSSPYPVIICGDFNDTPISYVYNLFYRAYRDAFLDAGFGIGSTYAGKVPAGRIDYIFHDHQLKTFNFVIQKEAYSDHYAISAELGKRKID